MPLSSEFFSAVSELRVPVMGTEVMAPLLHSLVRGSRPRNVLEVGMGYTTPFLAQALADNVADCARESEELAQKTAALIANPQAVTDEAGMAWLKAAPSWGAPGFYVAPYKPTLYAIDNLTSPNTSAAKVKTILGKLGLEQYVSVHDGNFEGYSKHLPADLLFDFVWFDGGTYEPFFDEYWDRVDGNGGLIVLHCHHQLDTWSVSPLITKLKLKLATNQFNDFELLTVAEPHKVMQNAYTIIRKTTKFVDPKLTTDKLKNDAMRFMKNRRT